MRIIHFVALKIVVKIAHETHLVTLDVVGSTNCVALKNVLLYEVYAVRCKSLARWQSDSKRLINSFDGAHLGGLVMCI